MIVQLGHVTHTWGEQPLPKILREIAAIGFKGVELFTHDVAAYYDDPESFGALLSSHELDLSSLYYAGHFINALQMEAAVEEAVRAAQFLRALGASHLIVGEGSGPSEAGVDYEEMAHTLNRIGQACLDMDVFACFHPHMGSVVENREQIGRIFEDTGPDRVFFCLDTGHIAKGGSDPVEVTRTYLGRLRFVHLKDMKDGRFVELGRGTIDHASIFGLLRQADYQGWILPEIPVSEVTEPTPDQSAQVSYRYLVQELGTEIAGHQEVGHTG